jgi:hypothetical protein
VTPSIFVCYRRADEPFAAALTATLFGGLVGDDEVFLDTLYLRQRGAFADDLLAAVRGCRLVLAVMGRAWDAPWNLARLQDEDDWVRRELREASAAGIPIVPVLVDRQGVPALDDLGVRFADPRLTIDPDGHALLDDGPRVERAVLAMLRHVLPAPQRSMDNDRTVARCVTAQLGGRDWLRFACSGNLPRRPNGSAVVFLTRTEVGIAQLSEDLVGRLVVRLPAADLVVRRTDRRRLWKPVADLHLTAADGRSVTIEGMFAEEADELRAMIA